MDWTQVIEAMGINAAVIQGISTRSVVQMLLLVVAGIAAIQIITKLLKRVLLRTKTLAPLHSYLLSAVRFALWVVLILMVAESLGIHTTSLIALFSVVGLAVSLSLQNALSNMAGGIMLLVTQPFQIGDYVETDGVVGTVKAIDLSYTTLATIDNKMVFLPNSHLSTMKIVNYTALGTRRVELTISVSYQTAPKQVLSALESAAQTLPQVFTEPAPQSHIDTYQSNHIKYTLWVWCASADYLPVYYGLLEMIPEVFSQHGIPMGYEEVNVHLHEQ